VSAARRAHAAAQDALQPLVAQLDAGGGAAVVAAALEDDAVLQALSGLRAGKVAAFAAGRPSVGGVGVVAGDAAAAAEESAPPPAAWEPAARIVRAVLLGDELWRRAERHYPPALPGSCAACEWEEAGIRTKLTAADRDGSLVQTGRPPHRCGRELEADGGDRRDGEAGDAGGVGAGDGEGPRWDTPSGLPAEVEDRLTRFVQRWRAMFLARLQPRALPEGWAVAYRVLTGGMRKRGKEECALVEAVARHFWIARGT
jgi:hypothetical protein